LEPILQILQTHPANHKSEPTGLIHKEDQSKEVEEEDPLDTGAVAGDKEDKGKFQGKP
jgi:hypothetical protein